jgi:hypothetical protein
VSPEEVLERLLELARETGLAVRFVPGAPRGEGEPGAASGVCRVRGELWVVLSRSDPPQARIAVLAGALRAERGEELESRYLPPAVREWLGRGPSEGRPGSARSPASGPDLPRGGRSSG